MTSVTGILPFRYLLQHLFTALCLAAWFAVVMMQTGCGLIEQKERKIPITVQELGELGRLLESAFNTGDQAYIGRKFDIVAFVERIEPGTRLTKADERIIGDALNGEDAIISMLFHHIQNGGRYTSVEARFINDEPRILGRIVINTGMVYFDFVIGRRTEHRQFDTIREVVIQDLYLYTTGEFLSNTFRTSIQRMQGSNSIVQRMLGKGKPDNGFLHAMAIRDSMEAASKREDFEAVIAMYRALPEPEKKEKFILITLMEAAEMIDDSTTVWAVDEYVRHHPTSPSTLFHLLSKHMAQGDYRGYATTAQKLDSVLGGEPYLQYQIGTSLLEAFDTVGAVAVLREAIKEEPKLAEAYMPLIVTFICRNNFREAKNYLNNMIARMEYSWNEVDSILLIEAMEEPNVMLFTESPEYAQLRASRMKKNAPDDLERREAELSAAQERLALEKKELQQAQRDQERLRQQEREIRSLFQKKMDSIVRERQRRLREQDRQGDS